MATDISDTVEAGVLSLGDVEREVLVDEVAAFADTLRDPEARERYHALAGAAAEGEIPESLNSSLGAMLELVLQTQRIRRQHGIDAERALTRLFYKTPRGAALKASADEVNQALKALVGQEIVSMSFSPTPGGQKLSIMTDRCSMGLTIDRAGVRVDRLEVAG